MKEYPSIEGPSEAPVLPCIAFHKYDGSNLRFAWQRKQGWCQFGTRRRLFTAADPEYGCAIELFLAKYAVGLEKCFRENPHFRGAAEVICYAEFFGPNSFGGQHDINHPALQGATHNDPKQVVLFDVNIHRKGLLPPAEFVQLLGHLPVAEVVYTGDLTLQFIQDVREGRLPVSEGVVCKGLVGKAPHGLWMRKIKTYRYLEELKKRFGTGWEQYWE